MIFLVAEHNSAFMLIFTEVYFFYSRQVLWHVLITGQFGTKRRMANTWLQLLVPGQGKG